MTYEIAYAKDTKEIYIYDGTSRNLVGRATVGLSGARPSAGVQGRWYFASDTEVLSLDSGASWSTITVSTTNMPSADQKAALAGTSGTPGAGNKFVTDQDARLSSPSTGSFSNITAGTGGAGTYTLPSTSQLNVSGPAAYAALGSDLVTNGGFSSDSGWTTGDGWAISGGVAARAAGAIGRITVDPDPLATTVDPDNGSGCQVTILQVDASGAVKEVYITNGGSGYSVNDVLTLVYADATTPCTLTVLGVSTEAVLSVKITTEGAGYKLASGAGYAVDDVVTVDGPGTDGTATVTEVDSNGAITGLTVTTRGSGYTAQGTSLSMAADPTGYLYCTYGTTAVWAPDTDSVYIYGGSHGGGVQRNNYRYSFATNTYSTYGATNPPPALHYHRSCYYNGKIFIIGGLEVRFASVVQKIYAYTIATDSWEEITWSGSWWIGYGGVVVGNRFYQFLDASAGYFDLDNYSFNSLSITGNINNRYDGAWFYDPPGNRIIVGLGEAGYDASNSRLASWAQFNLATNTWSPLAVSGSPYRPRNPGRGFYVPHAQRFYTQSGRGGSQWGDQYSGIQNSLCLDVPSSEVRVLEEQSWQITPSDGRWAAYSPISKKAIISGTSYSGFISPAVLLTFPCNYNLTNGSGSGGKCCVAIAEGRLEQSCAVNNGDYVEVTYTVSRSAGSVKPYIGGVAGECISATVTGGKQYFLCSNNTNLLFLPSDAFSGSVDNISVKIVTQRPATITCDSATLWARNTNHAVGESSGKYIVGDTGTTTFGYRAGRYSQQRVTAVGSECLTNSYGSDSTGVGYQALYRNVQGINTAVGAYALYNVWGDPNVNGNGSGNCALGYLAGYSIYSWDTKNCTFLGHSAGYQHYTSSGQNYLYIAAGGGNVLWGQADHVGTAGAFNLRGNFLPSAHNTYSLGSTGARWKSVYCQDGTFNGSDERQKEDIMDTWGTNFVVKMADAALAWKWKDEELTQDVVEGEEEKEIITTVLDDEGNEIERVDTIMAPKITQQSYTLSYHRKHHGFSAQRVKAALDDLDIDTEDFAGYAYDSETDTYALRMHEFIPQLYVAIKEIDTRLKVLEGA